MSEILDKIGGFFTGILEKISSALGGEKATTNILVALAMIVTAVVMFLLRKKIMKPVIRYRKKRAAKRMYRKRKK